jgi:hypothetical protein
MLRAVLHRLYLFHFVYKPERMEWLATALAASYPGVTDAPSWKRAARQRSIGDCGAAASAAAAAAAATAAAAAAAAVPRRPSESGAPGEDTGPGARGGNRWDEWAWHPTAAAVAGERPATALRSPLTPRRPPRQLQLPHRPTAPQSRLGRATVRLGGGEPAVAAGPGATALASGSLSARLPERAPPDVGILGVPEPSERPPLTARDVIGEAPIGAMRCASPYCIC